MKNQLLTVPLLCTVLLFCSIFSQANELYPVSLTEKINHSTLIAEGQVISQSCFKDASSGNIFTSNIVRVYRIFKGNVSPQEIEVITHGGTVGDHMQVYSSYLKLGVGETGLFFCMPSTARQAGATGRRPNSYMVYSSMQGFIVYDTDQQTAADPFARYASISEAVNTVKQRTNLERLVQAGPFLQRTPRHNTGAREMAAPSISGFSPTSVAAGVNDILTISGSGFGATRGTGAVEFKNADNGGSGWVKPVNSDYVSWTDTEIRVRVPASSATYSSAGSGAFRVINNDPDTVVSGSALTIRYSYTNIQDGSANIYRPIHYAVTPSTGGYVFRFAPDFVAIPAACAALTRAMHTWTCATGINWKVGANTTLDVDANDGVNVIRFENGNELPNGVLAVCISNYGLCMSPIRAIVTDIDMVFDNQAAGNFIWQYGPALANSAEVDLETVALHELGHGHQLSHVIRPGAVMHFAIGKGQNTRTLSAEDIEGGARVTTEASLGSCVPTMTAGEAFLMVTNPSAICSGNTFSYSPVTGTGIMASWSRPVVSGISNSAASSSGNITETLTNTTGSPVVVTYNYTLSGTCSGTETVSVTVNPLTTTLAGTAGGASVCASQTVVPAGTTFTDASCNPMLKIVPSGASPVTGTVNVCAESESALITFNSQPYGTRHYDVEPASNASSATATLTLYYTQAEFDAYNSGNGSLPDLPTGSGDATGIANLRITQYHGTSSTNAPGTYSGSTEVIDPADSDIIYNATAGRWEISFPVAGFSGFFVSTAAPAALPLRLLSFSGRKSGSSNLLSWTTASESGIVAFEVQRSTNGSDFFTIGNVSAQGSRNSNNLYSYSDDISGTTSPIYYYRLRIIESNGQPSLSKIVQLKDASVFQVKALENPFSQSLAISISSPVVQESMLTVTDLSGRQLTQQKVVLQVGNAVVDVPGVNGLPAGTYVLVVTTSSNNKAVIKVLKR